jgi:hypothetical protein
MAVDSSPIHVPFDQKWLISRNNKSREPFPGVLAHDGLMIHAEPITPPGQQITKWWDVGVTVRIGTAWEIFPGAGVPVAASVSLVDRYDKL